ncbi:hypothetical protein V6N12_025065 [Hibiscus sabdariffa]|uniref:Secreted protein n=2 Tax=Hibiscus sabdariffa TaxID=183260 RepID=A0ABR2BN59_9ROSI
MFTARSLASMFQLVPLTVPAACSRTSGQTELCQPGSRAPIAREPAVAGVVSSDISHGSDDDAAGVGHLADNVADVNSASEADINPADNVAGASESAPLAADESQLIGESNSDPVDGETTASMGADSSGESDRTWRSGENVVQFRWFVLTNHNLLSVEILLTDGFGSSCYFPPKV